MRLIIEAHLVDEDRRTQRVEIASVERSLSTEALGLTLSEGKALWARAQTFLVTKQCNSIAFAHATCEGCGARLKLKGWHTREIRTVFRSGHCP